MTLIEAALKFIVDQVRHGQSVDSEVFLQILTMCREASDAHLSAVQQSQLDMMIAVVVGDIITDNK